MKNFSLLLAELQKDESGQDIVEYALIGAVMGLGAVCTLQSIASGVVGIISTVASTISPTI